MSLEQKKLEAAQYVAQDISKEIADKLTPEDTALDFLADTIKLDTVISEKLADFLHSEWFLDNLTDEALLAFVWSALLDEKTIALIKEKRKAIADASSEKELSEITGKDMETKTEEVDETTTDEDLDTTVWNMTPMVETIHGYDVDMTNTNPDQKKLVTTALKRTEEEDIHGAKHCTDWLNEVAKESLWVSNIHALTNVFDGATDIEEGTGIGAKKYAPDSAIAQITAGQHLMLDKPKKGEWNKGRTHSVLTLWPVDSNGNILVVSYPNTKNKKPPVVETYNIYGKNEKWVKPSQIIRIEWPEDAVA